MPRRGEGARQEGQLVAVSAALESTGGDLNWTVMADVAAGKGWSGGLVGDPAGLGGGVHPGNGD